MQDPLSRLDTLKRPRLLVRAARLGSEDYRRTAHLQRVLGYGRLPRHAEALTRLLDLESEHEARRKENPASYSLAGHVDVLIAMAGEARILRASRAVPQP